MLIPFTFVIFQVFLSGDLLARPTTWVDSSTNEPFPELLRWPQFKTINVYIEPNARSTYIKEGIERWNTEVPLDVTFDVVIGDVPDPAPDNLVRVEYKPAGTSLSGLTLDGNRGVTQTRSSVDDDGNGFISGATAYFLDTLPLETNAEKELLRNLGQHEMTHVLGLADDPDGVVTDHQQNGVPNVFNEEDLKEILNLYPLPVPFSPWCPFIGGLADADTRRYEWNCEYVGPSDSHVALIVMDIDPSVIDSVVCPAGWECLDPTDPERMNLDYPFYQTYMEDHSPVPPLWDPAVIPPLAFRTRSAEAALSPSNPQLEVTLYARDDQVGEIETWAGGETQTMEGPVPGATSVEPSTWGKIKRRFGSER